jgi:hypothetical protein
MAPIGLAGRGRRMPEFDRDMPRSPSRPPRQRGWQGAGALLALMLVLLLLVRLDPDVAHRAGSPPRPLARFRVRLARWIAPGPEG